MQEVRSKKLEVRNRSNRLFLTFFVFIYLYAVSFAQEFTASVNETTVGHNDRFQVSFTFSGSNINNLTKFTPPSFESFLVLSGPNQSTSIQIINGAQSASLTYNYLVQPKSVGTFTIGSASIVQEGNTYKTETIKMTVVKGSDKPKQQNDNTGILENEIEKNLYILASIDKSKVYKGEQIILTYRIYKRIQTGDFYPNKMPQYQGFWSEQIELGNKSINYKREVVNGEQFLVRDLMRVALFPTQTGTLEVTPLELKIPVAVPKKKSKNIWDDFFGDPFGRTEVYDYNAKSNVVKVEVQPLPADQPESFKGAVGDYSFDAKLNSTTVKSNEPLTLKLDIAGTGNISLLEMPEINLPNGFEEYEPKINDQINRSGTISGIKSGEYLLVPRVVGRREIPPIEFSYFDPSKKKYVTLKSQPFNIDIKPGDKQVSTDIVGKEDIKELGNDIRFIKTSFNDIHKKEEYVFNSTGFLIASIFPAILGIGLIGWKRRYDKLHGNVVLLRYQKAQKVAKNRLKAAKKLMDTQNHKEFYTELSSALFGYLEDKLHIPKSEFTIERASDDLSNLQISDELISNLKTSAEKCEFVRFAPGAEKSTAMQDMYNEIAEVIISLEKVIPGRRNV